MCRRLLLLNALRTFEVAARHKSLVKAAEELTVTPAAVHHQIKSLEENLGVDLFLRTGNNLDLTQPAAAVLSNLTGAFDLLSLVTEQLKQYAKPSLLSVGTCPSFAQKWLIPRLSRFKVDFPNSRLQISTISQIPDLMNSEIDIAICYGSDASPRQDGTVVELLLEDEVYPVSSSQFCSRRRIRTEEDLCSSDLLHDDELERERKVGWTQWLGNAIEARMGDAVQFDTTVLALEAAIAGQGVALAPHSLAASDIAAGRLVRLFQRGLPARGGYSVAYLESVGAHPMVAAFREWLFAEASVNRSLLAPPMALVHGKRATA